MNRTAEDNPSGTAGASVTDTTTLIEQVRLIAAQKEIHAAIFGEDSTIGPLLLDLAAALASTVAERDAATEDAAGAGAIADELQRRLAEVRAERDAANKRLAEYVHDYDDVVEELGTAEAERDAAYTQRDALREALRLVEASAALYCPDTHPGQPCATCDAVDAVARATAEDGTP